MYHKPIQINELSLRYSHKTCFESFSEQICFQDRIAIIGANGAGKSTLLKILARLNWPEEGEIQYPSDLDIGYLPQIIHDFASLSGGQRLNSLLTKILAGNPNILLLDEPTNHLDSRNRSSLIRMLKHYPGTLIIVSHDLELIKATTHTLWHIDGSKLTVFSGSYNDYQRELQQKKEALVQELALFSRQKKEAHLSLMKEQSRAAKSRAAGKEKVKNKKWLKSVGDLKGMKAEKAQGKNIKSIENRKQALLKELESINLPEAIQAKFKLTSREYSKVLVTIQNASVGYQDNVAILDNIDFQMGAREKIALLGNNGSGKTTFIKAILGDKNLSRKGDWQLPSTVDIGYLDQHYLHLDKDKTVFDLMSLAMPKASLNEIRTHLNYFLFRKNEEVEMRVENLSGGEKARLSLALIAAKPPKLLILDELTNNLDIDTRTHLIEVLKNYPGGIILISHDNVFLEAIEIEHFYEVKKGKIECVIF